MSDAERPSTDGLQSRGARRHRSRGRNHDPRARGAKLPGLRAASRSRAIARSANACEFRGRHIPVIDVATFDFERAQIGLFSAGGEVSREYAPKAAAAGCIVIDNTSEFRYEDDIPLVVPEVNRARHRRATRRAASSPTPTARPSRWWWRSSRSTTRWASRASTWPPINPCPAPARKRSTSSPRRPPRS